MNLSIQGLRIFLAVAETGSFSAAARQLYMSQPSVSAHVRNLETSLSARLLDRGPAGATLTPAGEALAKHARTIFEVMDQVDEDVSAAQGIQDRKLSVAGTSTLGSYLLPQILGRPQHWTLSVLITDQAIYQSNMPFAAAMAVFLVLVTLGLVALTIYAGRKGEAA